MKQESCHRPPAARRGVAACGVWVRCREEERGAARWAQGRAGARRARGRGSGRAPSPERRGRGANNAPQRHARKGGGGCTTTAAAAAAHSHFRCPAAMKTRRQCGRGRQRADPAPALPLAEGRLEKGVQGGRAAHRGGRRGGVYLEEGDEGRCPPRPTAAAGGDEEDEKGLPGRAAGPRRAAPRAGWARAESQSTTFCAPATKSPPAARPPLPPPPPPGPGTGSAQAAGASRSGSNLVA